MGRTVIAERKLAFSEKEDSERKPLLIRIFAPQPVDPGSIVFRSDADTSSCIFEFEGIPDAKPHETFGADSIQALQLAIGDVEAILKRLSDRQRLHPAKPGHWRAGIGGLEADIRGLRYSNHLAH